MPRDNHKLLRIWRHALAACHPATLYRPLLPDEALLAWGKAASATARALHRSGAATLVVSPEPRPPWARSLRWVQAEHPVPGAGSQAAGTAILEFFATRPRRLRIALSGGASSLAWLPPVTLSIEDARTRWRDLVNSGLPIAELNRRRRELCVLKGGGAADWLRRLSPHTHARVEAISDVSPFGIEVLGSGPFLPSKIPHRILADSHTLLGAVRSATRRDRILAWTGEPRVSAPRLAPGGRLTHTAARFALDCARDGSRLEALFASTDGRDGYSGCAAVLLSAKNLASVARSKSLRARIKTALRDYATGDLFLDLGWAVPAFETGTNVQDLILVAAT